MPRRKLIALVLPLLTSGFALGQNFDTSGNGSLKGDYFIREILIAGQNATTGAITSANSVIGVATFDGNGGYTFKGQGTGTGTLGTVTQQTFTGTYAAGANGLLAVDSFISPTDSCFGGVSAIGPSGFVASATEGAYVDILVGIPAGANTSVGSFRGPYTAAYIDYLNADVTMIRQASFNATADGAGNLGNIAVAGNAANLTSGSPTNQTVSGVSYTLSGEGVGTVNFGGANSGQLISGSKTLYVSADGNIVMGGNPGGFDLFVGIRALTGPATNATANSIYYLGALDDAVTTSGAVTSHAIDGYYGSTNLNGGGVAISHNRIQSFGFSVYDFTYSDQVAVAPAGTFSDGQFYNYTLGANGQAFVGTGAPGYYSLLVGFGAQKYSGTGVFLNPLGVVSAANYAPITNPIAPNEIVTLFGSGLAANAVSAATLPLPTSLGNVQVLVNGQAAPLFYVTPGQIAFVVPQMVSPFFKIPNATIQVVNNSVKSNPVTVYTSLTAPGVFSASGNGIGPALAVHLSGALVSASNPAKLAETIVVFATGLGSVTPTVPDGFAAPSTPPSRVDDTTDEVDFGATASNLGFAGLVPGFAGFYQLNTTVASATSAGPLFVNLFTGDGATSETSISIAGTTAATSSERVPASVARRRPQARGDRGIKTDGLKERAINR